MVIPTTHFRSDSSSIPLRIAKGHFATNHSHLNYYIDMTYTKHRLAEAQQAAKELAVEFKTSTVVDTVLCLDGTEVLGTCIADELTNAGVRNMNKHETIYIGDSGIDMETARRACIDSVGVTWGFRPVKELKEYHANVIINKPQDIVPIVENGIPL